MSKNPLDTVVDSLDHDEFHGRLKIENGRISSEILHSKSYYPEPHKDCRKCKLLAILKAAEGDQHKPKHTNLKEVDVARQWLGGERQSGDPPV